MDRSWPAYAAVVAGAALLLKAVLIIGSENAVAEGPMTALFLGGLLLALAAAIGCGLQQRRGRRALTAVGLSLAVVFYVIGLSDGVGSAFAQLSDAPWVGDEGPVGLLGVVLLALGARGRARSPQPVLA